MSKTKTQKLSMAASLMIVFLAFGAFAGAAALLTKNQLSLAPTTSADEGEDDGGSDDDGDDNENDDQDENKDDGDDKAKEELKKKNERARESAKKQFERSNKSSDDDSEDDADEVEGDDDGDDNGGENDGDSDDDGNGVEGDDAGDDNGMFKDRDKTLEKLRKEIANARENILEKQAEGVDVTAALARLALAEASLGQVGSSFDVNDLTTAKMLAKQIKKTTHFAEKDLHDAEKIADEMAKVQKRFGQVTQKIASLEALGGDAAAFRAQLATLRADFAILQATLVATPEAITRDTVKVFEKRVKRLKSLIESSIFALGGDEDDDLFEDHQDDEDDLSEDLNDVAEIEDGDDNGVSGKVRGIAAAHKAAATTLKESLKDIKGRSGLAKALFGPDSGALETLNGEVAGMNARAVALDLAAAKVTDPDIKQILADQATALRSEALKLQSYMTAQASQSSLFGWFFNLF